MRDIIHFDVYLYEVEKSINETSDGVHFDTYRKKNGRNNNNEMGLIFSRTAVIQSF